MAPPHSDNSRLSGQGPSSASTLITHLGPGKGAQGVGEPVDPQGAESQQDTFVT